MAFVPVPNGAEFIVHGVLNGEQVVNTFNATKAGSWGLTELQAAADALATQWGTQLLPHLSGDYQFTSVHTRDLRTAVGVQCDSTLHAGTGGDSGAALPNNVTLAVARRSGLAGRSARGRVYLPGIGAGALADNNTVTSAFQIIVEAALNAITAAFDGVDWTEVIVSRVAAGVPLTSAVVYTVVEYLIADRVLDSMRRRLPGRGV